MRCRLFYTFKISIVFAIRSVDPTLGLAFAGLWRFYTPSAPLGLLKAGAQKISYRARYSLT